MEAALYFETMKTRYDVEVTQADLDEASRNHSSKCAVAVAVARAVPEATNISVDVQTIRFSLPPDRKRLIYLNPATVESYVVKFDAGDQIEPFRFQLRNPGWQVDMRPRVAGVPRPNISGAEAVVSIGGTGKNEVVRRKGVRPPAKPNGSKQRTFGHRSMRINQQD